MLRTLLLLMMVPFAAIAQTDYVITTKADTLRGEVRLLSYDNLDRIQINTGKKKELLTALQVLSVYYEGDFYKPVQYDKRIILMKQLKTGYLSLYAFRLPNQNTYDGRYLYRLDGKHLEVPNLSFRKIVSSYLEDCAAVSDKIKEGELGKKELNQILDEYNTCIATAKPSISEPSPQPVLNELVLAVQRLKQNLAGQEFTNKKDALDLVTDLEQKAARNEAIPNYLLEGLKSYLAPLTSAQPDLEKVLQLLKK